ncbi:hypothetical protein ACSV5M_17535 [Cellvibrio sp. ARAG 10.3]|uniref:hypothetical protein n=1 Tax=Cellvibrio sp. ARAG 10.3 TaxID=3451358 RepID=UPI003F451F18
MDKGTAPSVPRWRRIVAGQMNSVAQLMEAVTADFSENCTSPWVRLNAVKVKTAPYSISNTQVQNFRMDLRWRLTALGGDVTGLGEWTACDLLADRDDERGQQLKMLWQLIERETPTMAQQLRVYDAIRQRLRSEYVIYWRIIVALNDIADNASWIFDPESAPIVSQARAKLQKLTEKQRIEIEI